MLKLKVYESVSLKENEEKNINNININRILWTPTLVALSLTQYGDLFLWYFLNTFLHI